MDTWCHHDDFEVSTKFLLSTCNLHLHGTRDFRDGFFGPFVVAYCIGETAYRLDLSSLLVLHGVHNVLLLHDWQDNGVNTDVLPNEINREAEYEVSSLKGHRECSGKLEYLMSLWVMIVVRICG